MEDSLPLKWNFASVDGCKVMYGLSIDFDSKLYRAVAVDLPQSSVWVELARKEQLTKLLLERGFGDINDAKLNYLLRQLADLDAGSSAELTLEDNVVSITLASEVQWAFQLKKCDSHESSRVLSQLVLQSFSRVDRMRFEQTKLMELVASKDHFIRYLIQNYTAINGDELLRKFRKNNPANLEFVESFNSLKWNTKVREDYDAYVRELGDPERRLLQQLYNGLRSDHDIPDTVDSTIGLKRTRESAQSSSPVKFSSPFKAETQIKHLQGSQFLQPVKLEFNSSLLKSEPDSQLFKQAPSSPIKEEEDPFVETKVKKEPDTQDSRIPSSQLTSSQPEGPSRKKIKRKGFIMRSKKGSS